MDCKKDMVCGRWLLALFLACFVLHISAGQQFYPNGRYGRRNTIPALTGVNHDVFSAFNGGTPVRCVYSGFEDYYRCTRRDDSGESHGIE